ncbi:MAG: alanine racemase [Bdellovibrionales bacterium]|nr:alanine racemase [Bdellovibrionales bacterium]
MHARSARELSPAHGPTPDSAAPTYGGFEPADGHAPGAVDFPRLVAELRSQSLIRNFAALAAKIPGQDLLPMVKADGYGHDALWVARTLLGRPGLDGFGVATLEEGADLRLGLAERGRSTRIAVFSGGTPWSDDKGHFCERYGLSPVIATDEDWVRFLAGRWAGRIPYELKFNTGMNRLGLSLGGAPSVIEELKSRGAAALPSGVLSHLASGEDPRCALSRRQLAAFRSLVGSFAALGSGIRFHLANSAATWASREWRLSGLTQLVRPGLALYGLPPWRGARARDLEPVMTLRARVVTVRKLEPGDRVGYGGAYRVPPSSRGGRHVAIIAAGYADGVHRLLGAEARVILGGKRERYAGRISMDLSAVTCGPAARTGDWATLLGPGIDPWTQASACGTIPYELYTSIARRVRKQYL